MYSTQDAILKRIAGEKRNIRKACKALALENWTIEGVDNGEGFQRITNMAEAIEEARACDEGVIYFSREGQRRHIYIVLGNSPEEVICDYSANEDSFERIMNEVTSSF